MKRIMIDSPSVQSLFIEMYFNEHRLSSGTAFIVNSHKGPLLITNLHNVTGLRTDGTTLSSRGSIPNKIRVHFNRKNDLNSRCVLEREILDKDYKPLWKEHPKGGKAYDFVAMTVLAPENTIDIIPYNLDSFDPNIRVGPADIVSVVGYPFGKTVNGTAIWATGFVASEPEIDYEDQPKFLIDCKSRQGQSGSAVIAFRRAGFTTVVDGHTIGLQNDTVNLLGIYSGRINKESDLGIVWKASAIKELVDSL